MNPNTITIQYIHFVFSSPDYKTSFDEFNVQGILIKHYQSDREIKLKKILQTVYTLLENSGDISVVKNYIEKNPKFKMPWSNGELLKCSECTQVYISRAYAPKRTRAKRKLCEHKTTLL